MSKNKNSKSKKQKRLEESKLVLRQYMRSCLFTALFLSLFGTWLIADFSSEHQVTQYPEHTSYFFVNDYSRVLSEETEALIQKQAVALYEKTKAQIVVVTVPDTQADSLEDYSNHLAKQWGIGDEALDNGVLLLFTTEEPHVRLEIGRGLEGCLNDAKCGRILDDWAVDAKDHGRWNEAAINTWTETARVVYEEYGLTVPEELTTVSAVSEAKETNTMADATVPEPLTEKRKTTLLEELVSSFCIFWIMALLPFLFLCFILRPTKTKGKASDGSSYSYYTSSSDSWSSSGDSGGYSGGGGDFGGGGASR